MNRLDNNIHQIATPPTASAKEVPLFLYEFIKSFLYAVYTKKKRFDEFSVITMLGMSDLKEMKPNHISLTDEFGSDYFRVSNSHVDATVCYNGTLYQLTLRRIEDYRDFLQNYIYILGLEQRSKSSSELHSFLSKESVSLSPFNNSLIEIKEPPSNWSEDRKDIFVLPFQLESDVLNDIFLSQTIRQHIELFIQTLSNYALANKSLRYLFAGKPGTAKTKIIRAIAQACKGKATFIFTNGNERRIESLFEFTELFSPVVLCIDDIDLMTGSRDEGVYTNTLAQLLQKMDGFVKRDFFMLATTNDKKLVDLAASRPGRFDLILDVNLIHPDLYLSLVKSKTTNENVIALFDSEILYTMEKKRVTGAFIANLVKHLELVSSFEPNKLTQEYMLQMIKESFQGFYKEPEPTNGKTGFVLA
ncbi:MAG: ATP-binding protein [Ignavibacteriales bacterium]|nr:ATP-binding protein [Ignavibacteriales bacterium]